MAVIPWPSDEIERLAELHALGALETFPQPDFSAIAELAARTCQTPIGLVNLVGEDRQYFKGHFGIAATSWGHQTSSYCPYVISTRELLEVPDALADERFRDDPIVTREPHARFYAGVPIISTAGHALGAICVMDHTPRELIPAQRRALTTLATSAANLLQAQHQAEALKQFQEISKREVRLLRRVTGDLNAPLSTLRAYLQLIHDGHLDETTAGSLVQTIKRDNGPLAELIDELMLLASLNTRLAAFTQSGQERAGNGPTQKSPRR
ncbi:GAF domain-containing protein [Planomonospora sp. ID67723]|uniref:GAF domain-containing protein n=1 Tax=Planomonospora sp. ID67723 TaxID=2738134 RepID=UPI0018C3AF2F|nr:GAF domain-containing protein [Planomonospora sp. ID67723]MBG0826992.1 GAF domain-containing protein [Planomonospora sp. ID67723]